MSKNLATANQLNHSAGHAPPLYESLIDKRQLADRLGISPSYVNKLMLKGLPRLYIGRAVRFRFSEAVAFLERMQ